MSPLKLNDYGIEVLKVQLLLNFTVRPCPFLTPTGVFNFPTRSAVLAFQKAKGLTADGKVGPKTRAALGLKPVSAASLVLPSLNAPWFNIAQVEDGVRENMLPGMHTARIIEYHRTTTLKASDDETPWCSSFVNWVMIQSGRKGTNSALAKSWLDWGVPVVNPERGVIVVIKQKTGGANPATGSGSGYHVGFYVSSTATHINILGGNQGVPGEVKETNFPLKSQEIMGYRKPN